MIHSVFLTFFLSILAGRGQFFYLDIAYAQYQDLVAVPFAAQDGSIVANVSYYGRYPQLCCS